MTQISKYFTRAAGASIVIDALKTFLGVRFILLHNPGSNFPDAIGNLCNVGKNLSGQELLKVLKVCCYGTQSISRVFASPFVKAAIYRYSEAQSGSDQVVLKIIKQIRYLALCGHQIYKASSVLDLQVPMVLEGIA